MNRPARFREAGWCAHAWRVVHVGELVRPGVLAQYPCRACSLCGRVERIA